jgi:hypothetical protein
MPTQRAELRTMFVAIAIRAPCCEIFFPVVGDIPTGGRRVGDNSDSPH